MPRSAEGKKRAERGLEDETRGKVAWISDPGMLDTQERHALLIGNSDYEVDEWRRGVSKCTNDAWALARTLESHHFDTETILNKTQKQMKDRIKKWIGALPKNCVALLSFAGHGVETKGVNYLVPTDASEDLADEADVHDQCVSLEWVMDKLLRHLDKKSLVIVLLDCCREETSRGLARGSGKRGLASINLSAKDAASVFVGYAAVPGENASERRNG